MKFASVLEMMIDIKIIIDFFGASFNLKLMKCL